MLEQILPSWTYAGICFGFRRKLEEFNEKEMSFSILSLLMEKAALIGPSYLS